MEKMKENTIILIKKGKQKQIDLPMHGEVVIKIQDGMPVKVESISHGTRFEDL